MAKLSRAQREFLAAQGVHLDKTFNAEGLPQWLYREVMRGDDLWVAYGVTPCKAGGHTLRTRTGSCIQCSTAQLAFVKRWYGPGYMYVAHSSDIAASKIGVASDPVKRVSSLNNMGYGGARDWVLFNNHVCPNMGFLEHQVHAQLSSHRIHASYFRDGYPVQCQELFSKSPKQIWKLVLATIKNVA